MNDVTSVPARIVVIGTSKKKLAERFKDLSPDRRVSRRSSPSSRRSSRPPPSEPKATFLHDSYMDNNLFERRLSRAKRIPPPPRDEYLSGVSEEEDEDEVVNIRANMPRRQRQIDVLFNGNSLDRRPRSNFNGYDDYDDVDQPMRPRFPPRRHFVYVNRRRFRPMQFIPLPKPLPKRLPVSIPLEERISILRQHNQMPFVRRGYRSGGGFSRMRPNLKRLQHFVPRDRDRFGFAGRRERRGGLRQFNSDNPRARMTTTDLDQELDQYMKSSKHPRVTVD